LPEASGVDQRGLHQRFAISPELPAPPASGRRRSRPNGCSGGRGS